MTVDKAVNLGSAGETGINTMSNRQFHCAFQQKKSGITFMMVTRLLSSIFALKLSSVSIYTAYLIACGDS